jgi:hypothetical protein
MQKIINHDNFVYLLEQNIETMMDSFLNCMVFNEIVFQHYQDRTHFMQKIAKSILASFLVSSIIYISKKLEDDPVKALEDILAMVEKEVLNWKEEHETNKS